MLKLAEKFALCDSDLCASLIFVFIFLVAHCINRIVVSIELDKSLLVEHVYVYDYLIYG